MASAYDSTVEAIYEAALEPERWPVALERMSRMLNGRGTQLYWTRGDPRQLAASWTWDLDPASIEEYDSGVVEWDTRLAAAGMNPPGTVGREQDFITEAEMDRDPYYADFAAKYGLRYCVGGTDWLDDGLLLAIGIQRGRQEGPFDDAEAAVFGRVFPHLRTAARLQLRLLEERPPSASIEALLDRAAGAFLILSDSGQPLYVNPPAEEILNSSDGLAVRHGELRCAHPEADAALKQLLLGLRAPRAPAHATVAVPRLSARRPYGVSVFPVRTSWRQHGFAVVGVMEIVDPERARRVGTDRLRVQFQLTPAEARFAEHFARTGSLDRTAEELGLARETARWRMKQVLGKTGTRRQAELVGLLLRSAGSLDATD